MRRVSRTPSPEGLLLYNLRVHADITQHELEARSGVHFTEISRYETGRVRPAKQTVARILDALQVTDEMRETVMWATTRPYERTGSVPVQVPVEEPERSRPALFSDIKASVFSDAE